MELPPSAAETEAATAEDHWPERPQLEAPCLLRGQQRWVAEGKSAARTVRTGANLDRPGETAAAVDADGK